jgi:hypothetical protein
MVEDAAPLNFFNELVRLVVRTIPALVVLIDLGYFVLNRADIGVDVEQLDIEGFILSPLHHPHSRNAIYCVGIGKGELSVEEEFAVDVGFVSR